jgi:hypothetical protein
MDFIGPFPLDENCNCILSMTDRLGSNIRIVPTHINIATKDLMLLFFNNWYCENGLPDNIVTDRNKLFVSKFWCALHNLTGVKLKLSSAYHLETDGVNEHSNKMINQCIHYNASTGFSNFQIHLGHSPHLIPPIVPKTLAETASISDETKRAQALITQLQNNVNEAKDNLLQVKVFQTHYANLNRSPEIPFCIGDKVMLSTLHHCQEYKWKGEKQAAKFFPHFDGPYQVIDVHTATLNYTLELPNSPNTYPTYHTSELKLFLPNDTDLFPSQELLQPLPIVTPNGLKEYLVKEIINSRQHGRSWQYLVGWTGYGPERDHWLTGSALKNCEALDVWLGEKGTATW